MGGMAPTPNPNFESSCPVVMKSWVEGRIPGVTRISTSWGRATWGKTGLALVLAVFQAIAGHRGLLFGYLSVTFVIVAISVMLVRPVLF